MCGGTAVLRVATLCQSGLSPRVRGNRPAHLCRYGRAGSIPACAGEPQNLMATISEVTVYPRVCGGTETVSKEMQRVWGLSPRVRGNLVESLGDSDGARSIPACAGEPPPGLFRTTRKPVYPRVCGGTPFSTTVTPAATGLSPRVRGNQLKVVPSTYYRGSIPACAGEPELGEV